MFYSVCIPAVLGKLSAGQALAAAAKAGFKHYEFWSWWDQDLDAYLEVQQKEKLSAAGICTRFEPLTDDDYHDAYIAGLQETVEICKKLNCKTIISQVGAEQSHLSRQQQHDNLVKGLRRCVPILEGTDITLVIEPLNTRIDHIGYYLWSSKEAYQIIEEVGSAHVKVLFDLYHQYIMEDLVIEDIVKNIDKIGHFHMAGYPGRHEPLIDSEIDYITILSAIRDAGFEGGIGLEYMPVYDAAEGLKELFGQLPK